MLSFMSVVVLVILAPVVVGTSASAQVVELAENLSGCYDLTLGEWDPALHPGNVTRQTPPGVFLLSPEMSEVNRRVVHPLIPHGMRPTARWEVSADDSVHVVWSNGFSGARLRMQASGDSLVGTAVAVTDMIGRPVPTTEALARPVSCPEWLLDLSECPDC